MNRLRRAWPVLTSALQAYSHDRVPMMGAALAYYTVFSIAPLLVIAMGLAGLFFGDKGGEEILGAISGVAGGGGSQAIIAMVKGAASRPHAGYVATVIGVITLLVGASGVFGQLQDSLNVIWKVQPAPDAPWTTTLRRRLMSFGMVGVIAFILLASLLVTAGLSAAGKYLREALPGGAASWQALNAGISLTVVTGLFGLIYKVLPDARLLWRDALRGGFWTGILFTAGQYAIGLYLGRAGVASVVALLLWVYWSAQTVLFGAELTRAYGLREHHTAAPRPFARRAHAGSR
jgi:membrane protein